MDTLLVAEGGLHLVLLVGVSLANHEEPAHLEGVAIQQGTGSKLKENIATYIWRKLGVLSFLTGAQIFRDFSTMTLNENQDFRKIQSKY